MENLAQNAPPREMRQTDVMDPARAAALLATLGLPAAVQTGDALPPFFHQIYFWQALPPAELGRDGHPATGASDNSVIPDLGLPRRMWAGGRLEFHASLRAGLAAEKITTVADISRKTGRSGPLGFVTLQHDIMQDGQLTTASFRIWFTVKTQRPMPPSRSRRLPRLMRHMRSPRSSTPRCCFAIRP